MNLHELLKEREAEGQPIRVGLIGSGRFGTMYLSQARNIPGVRVLAIADINTARARESLARVGWPEGDIVDSVDDLTDGKTAVIADAMDLFRTDIDVIVEATGNPIVGIKHALAAIDSGKHVMMVTVEADALAGPALAKRAKEAGVVYSMAFGDQPALIWELVDWARTSGFDVVCAGKGAKYLPGYNQMNPDNVWDHWEFSDELKQSGQLNPYMHTSFRDGTKAAIEMAAVANAAALVPSDEGLSFTPGNLEEIATVCRPKDVGGVLSHEGTVDVMSSYTREGDWIPHNTQEGVFVVVKATNDYVSGCFQEYPWHPDPTGQYAALYRPYHYVGLELNVSIANAVLRGIATGTAVGFTADVVATAKKDLAAGDTLDGEGGFAVYGKLVSARTSVAEGYLPVALAHHVPLKRDIAAGESVRWDDVEIDDSLAQAIELRRETEALAAASAL
ncbi:flagellar biosynthesis protein FlgA [Agrococcus lahaulensis]|jgi:predicted homoserine dehydrogenase-like protein|uniref:NAD(P)H-dependent oxidoreductase n=1 Tax=Agrococcus TaxID=46352 RepID=UPI000FE35001|nr:Gfo/Idh/MocA family oxidoreductase [Agrococcus sp. BE272]MDR7233659.1 putative homoserine dehydrogenase-like protein [Agrococcus sp. BE272]RWR20404.1 flagellar biosynthesis protein FlgA [Agrococcus lahaulensis]